MRIETIPFEEAANTPHLVGDWHALATAHAKTVFQTYAWTKAWVGSFASGPTVLLIAREGNALAGVLPLSLQSRSIHRRVPIDLRFWGIPGAGIGAADHVSPLAATGETETMLLAAALGHAGHSNLLLEHMDNRLNPKFLDLGLDHLGMTRVPRLDLSEVDDPANIWNKKLRKNLRRRRGQMADIGITGRWIDEPAKVEAAVGKLADLHRERWENEGQTGIFDDDRLEFLTAFCRHLEEPFRPSVYALEQDEAMVGGLLVFVTPNSMSSYKTGWRPDLAKYGIGIELHASAIERAIESRLSLYDFLRGTGSHKYSLGAHDLLDVSYGSFPLPTGGLLRARERTGYSRHDG